MTMKGDIQYGVWQEPEGDGDSGYWALYDTLADAVQEADGEDIYEMNPVRLGRFKIRTTVAKVRDKKKS